MNQLEGLLRSWITSNGPITFAEYQETALYHPEFGYYAQSERSGWHGHFLTSAELDPAFGALWAVGFRRVWEELDRPADFEVIEIGPGEGGFAHAVLSAVRDDFRDALTYRLVERIPALTERQMSLLGTFDNVVWSTSIEEVSPVSHGCVTANEVLDNLPVHLVELGGEELVELYVGASGTGLELVRGALSDSRVSQLASGILRPDEGGRVEVGVAAVDFVQSCAAAIARGRVFLIDYGVTWRELERRPSGTLVCYSSTGADDEVLERPGDKDITSHANWDVVGAALEGAGCRVSGPTPQRSVLQELGLGDLQESVVERQRDLAASGRGAAAVRALSRRHALNALGDPAGLGGLEVMIGARD
ncbi:MAG: class I SAM-dependent methyltransferase [Actinomycetota bacterium]